MLGERRSDIQSSLDFSRSQESSQDGSRGGIISRIRHGKQRLWTILYATFVASLGSLLFGFSLGYSSPVLLQLGDPLFVASISHAPFNSSDKYTDLFGGLLPVGAAIGGITIGSVADFVGRRQAMMLSGIPYFIGWALIAVSRVTSGPAFYGLTLTGRFITGYACGCASLLVPMYISESAPAFLRGTLGAWPQMSVVLGIGIVYGLGAIPAHMDAYDYFSYEYIAAIACVLVLVYEILLFTIKDSPTWLIRKQYRNAARNSLRWLLGPLVNLDHEVEKIERSQSRHKRISFLQALKLFRKRTVWKPLVLTCFIMFFQQFSGINAVIFYSGTIFTSGKVPKPALVATGTVGGIQIIATFICVLLTDLVGRKILLSVGAAGMALSSIAMGVYFFEIRDCSSSPNLNATTQVLSSLYSSPTQSVVCSEGFSALAIVSMIIYIATFSIGWGAIPWLLSSEMFPMVVRGQCMGIATFLNWMFASIISFGYQEYADDHVVHPYGAFWTFAGICILAFIFVLIFLPETKGKTLDEIEAGFAGRHVDDLVLQEGGVNVVL